MNTLLSLTEPLGILWFLLTWHLARHILQRRHAVIWLPACAWLVLTVSTCTPLSSLLLGSLERQYPPVPATDLANCDAIVCLGGGVSPSPPELSGVHLKSAADRLPTALVLAKMKKAPFLVLGGGGYKINGTWRSEADALKALLDPALGLPVETISLGLCADTHDEAVKAGNLANAHRWKSILLVTSAYHMPRAVAAFERQGLKVVPAPCNYITSTFRGTERHLLHPPSYKNLESISFWIHEVVGTLFYRWKGWI